MYAPTTPDIAVQEPGWATAADRQEAARRTYRQSVANGRPLTGVALGAMYGRSARWGTDRTAEVRAELAAALEDGNGSADSRATVHRLPIGSRPAAADDAERTSAPDNDPRRTGMPGPAAEQATGTPPAGPSATPNAVRHADAPAPAPSLGGVWERRALSAGKAAVRLVAAAISYEHMRTVAEAAGESGWRATLLPLSVDGLALLALVTMTAQRREGRRPSPWAWVALTLALVASLAANIAAAQPTATGRVVAAWPPVALFLAEVLHKPRRDGPTSLERSEPRAGVRPRG